MTNLDNVIVMREKFLEELNKSIDVTIKEKERMKINYDWIEKITGKMTQNRTNNRKKYPIANVIRNNCPRPVELSTMNTDEMIKLAVDFFKSIDENIYKLAVETILQQKEKISMYIYNIHNIKDFSETEDNGIIKYDKDGSVMYDNGNAIVHIPLGDKKKENSDNICSLDDAYLLVHEISHLFDVNLEDTLPKIQLREQSEKKTTIKINETRELLAETTAIAFEGLFRDYLLQNTLYSKEEILQNQRDRLTSSYNHAESVYANLLLARIKEKKGEKEKISNEDIEEIMCKFNLSVQDVRFVARRVIASKGGMQMEKRYAIAGLLAPTIVQGYRKDKEQGKILLKRYLEEIKNNNFQGALDVFGITTSNEGISKLIQALNEQEKELYPDVEISK